jgi:hypothetical protein
MEVRRLVKPVDERESDAVAGVNDERRTWKAAVVDDRLPSRTGDEHLALVGLQRKRQETAAALQSARLAQWNAASLSHRRAAGQPVHSRGSDRGARCDTQQAAPRQRPLRPRAADHAPRSLVPAHRHGLVRLGVRSPPPAAYGGPTRRGRGASSPTRRCQQRQPAPLTQCRVSATRAAPAGSGKGKATPASRACIRTSRPSQRAPAAHSFFRPPQRASPLGRTTHSRRTSSERVDRRSAHARFRQ